MDRLDQLFARSHREIEAHTDDLSSTETGRYLIDEAAHLLAALRLWAQSKYRFDQVVREILEAADVVALQNAAHELREMRGLEARTASGTLMTMARLPSAQLQAIASYALRAL